MYKNIIKNKFIITIFYATKAVIKQNHSEILRVGALVLFSLNIQFVSILIEAVITGAICVAAIMTSLLAVFTPIEGIQTFFKCNKVDICDVNPNL